MAPYFLKYIQKPTVYYCQQPPRNEKILDKVSKQKRKKRILEPLIQLYVNHVVKSELKLDQKNVEFAKYTLANSYYSHESILKSYGINSFVSYLGVDIELFRPLNIPKKDFVLSVGTCIPPKGYEFIIKSLAEIDSDKRPKLYIVSNMGDDQWKEYLAELAQDKGVDLEILSLVDDQKLVKLYNEALLVLYAPYLEPFGLVPLEAMACGTPVVAVKEGGVRETVNNQETGILTDRDEVLFAEEVVKLLYDDEKRLSMSLKAIETVTSYWTLEHASERMLWHLERAKDGKTAY
jgi:glycosyltransferase involved in cell wall biosynthesis